MTSVFFQVPRHLAPVLGVLVAFYYVYALLGLTLFHGVIEHPSNGSSKWVSNSYNCIVEYVGSVRVNQQLVNFSYKLKYARKTRTQRETGTRLYYRTFTSRMCV